MFDWKNFFKKWYIFIFIGIIYIPLILIVIISFAGSTGRGNMQADFSSFGFTASNYLDLFHDDTFLNSLSNSLLLGLTTTPFVVIIATLTCFGMWKSRNYIIKSCLTTSNLTIISPDAITGISLLVLFSSTIIPLGGNFGFFTVALAHISFGVPYAIIVIYPRMSKFKMNLIYASYDMGYGNFSTFFKVIVPYLLPAIISGASIAFAMSLDDFIITNMVNGTFQTIGTSIYSTRKGIKAWVITFGAIIVIITIITVVIMSVIKAIKLSKERRTKLSLKFSNKSSRKNNFETHTRTKTAITNKYEKNT